MHLITASSMATDSGHSGTEDGATKPGSKIRVTFFESERPLITPDTPPLGQPADDENTWKYLRQTSAESGQDNPFRPDGNLSREADEIVQLIKRGKPVVGSPADENKNHPEDSGVMEHPQTVINASPEVTASKYGSNGSDAEVLETVEVKHVVLASPSGAATVQHVHLKKDKGCCVIQ